MADLIDRAPKRIWIEDPDEKMPYFYEESELHEVAAFVVEYVRADLVALPAQGVRVKPLVWETYDAWSHWAESAVGTYRVNERNGVWKATLDRKAEDTLIYEYTTDGTTPDDFQAAQLAAQADYERRILAALAPAEAHDEQLGVWADELMADLVLSSLMDLVDYEYDTKVGARRMIIDALKAANQAKVPAPAPVDALVKAAAKVVTSYWQQTDGTISGIYDLERALAAITEAGQ